MVRGIFLFLTLWLVLLATNTLHAAELKVRTSHTQISINESVTLELTATGSIDGDPDLSVLKNDFDIVNKSQSSQMQYINGNFNKSKVWNLTLVPKRIGSLTIPPLCSGSDCSDPVTLIVQQQNSNDTSAAKVIIEAEISSHKVVAQQQLIYTVRLLFRQSLLQAGLGELSPEGVETTVQSLGDDVRYETNRGNWRYQVIERKFALFPQHAGQLHLPPLRFNGQIEAKNRSRFNSAFDNFRQSGQIIRLQSEALDVTVTEPAVTSAKQPWLPAEKIIIGDDWQQSAPTLTVGEPATRTIVTTATGLTAAQLPELTIASPASFKTYPDKTKREDRLGTTGIVGTMEQKIAFVPTQPGTFTLPTLQLKWWDVGNSKWRTETTQAVTVQVLPAQHAVNAPVNNVVENKPSPPQPITPIPPAATPSTPGLEVDSVANNQGQSIWIWISAICASGWFITLVLLYKSRNLQQEKKSAKTQKVANNETPKSKARAELIRCALSNDSAQTHKALHVWIQAVAPNTDAETFIKQSDPPLQQQISALNSALYSASGADTWSGKELAMVLKSWSDASNKKSSHSLPDFYPKG